MNPCNQCKYVWVCDEHELEQLCERYRNYQVEREEPLAAAKGIKNGIVISLAIWAILLIGWWVW